VELPLDLSDAEPLPTPRRQNAVADADPSTPAEEPVDPSISAGVFVAFGRFDEAEQMLATALQRQPERADLKLQLLDVYLQGDKRAVFEALADSVERDHDDAEVLAELVVLRNNYQAHH
jgi:pilus assembly protein FimV